MVTTFTYKPSLMSSLSMHAISSCRGNRHTHTHTPTNRQDRLQYTAPHSVKNIAWCRLAPCIWVLYWSCWTRLSSCSFRSATVSAKCVTCLSLLSRCSVSSCLSLTRLSIIFCISITPSLSHNNFVTHDPA